MIDAHCHIAQLGYLAGATNVGPDVAKEISDIQDILSRASPDESGWIVGRGYADYALVERRSPTRDDLDHAVRDAPCVIYHASLHECVLNTSALRQLGLLDVWDDPPGGRYGRDQAGRLDGRAIEAPMFTLFAAAISERLQRDGRDLVARATAHLASFGITSCIDANTTADEVRALADAARADLLAIRVGSLCRFADLQAIVSSDAFFGIPADTLRIVGAKVFADGGMTNRTAAVEPAYDRPAGEKGLLLMDERAIADAARKSAEHGLGLGVHAQGERAIGAAVAALRSADRAATTLRRIEHGGAFSPALQRAAADADLTVVSQPAFISVLGDGFIDAFGSRRARYLYPFRTLLGLGMDLAFSSDAPVVTPSPWVGARDAQLRLTAGGAAMNEQECLTADEVLERYTRAAARSGAPAPDAGSLAAGRPADFVVIDDPLLEPAEKWGELRVVATVVSNRVRFGDVRRPSSARA
jgi:predicted amidohydrolase YtcJ